MPKISKSSVDAKDDGARTPELMLADLRERWPGVACCRESSVLVLESSTGGVVVRIDWTDRLRDVLSRVKSLALESDRARARSHAAAATVSYHMDPDDRALVYTQFRAIPGGNREEVPIPALALEVTEYLRTREGADVYDLVLGRWGG